MDKHSSLASLILRLGMGGMMLVHGYGKLERLMDGNWDFADPLGIGSAPTLLLAVFTEFLCSVLLIIGFKTRLASIPLIITMLIAAFVIHLDDPWKRQEFALLYAVGFIAILILGGGRYSLDDRLSHR